MKRQSLAVVVICLTFAVLSFTATAQAQVSFFQAPTYSGSGTVFVADFNGDGKPDILTSDGTLNLGNGDGTFRLGTSISGSAVPVLAVGDFNGDGRPDVLQQGTGTLLVLLGKGDGTFQAPISTASGASLYGVVAGDVNGDGKADVLGVFNNAVVVYLSRGDGTFASGVSYGLGANASVAAPISILGDFNGDGKEDVAVITAGNNVVGQEIVLLGNGDGTFRSPLSSVGIYYPNSAVAGDFNGDGKLDLAISMPQYGNGTPATTYVLPGNGDGTFQTPVAAIPINGPLATADLNGDGKLDLVLQYSVAFAEIWFGNGDGTFSNARNYILNVPFWSVDASATGIAIADFNLDGKLDLATGEAVLLSNGDGTFQGIQLALLPTSISASTSGTVIGDFEKNGTPDVAVLSTQEVSGTNSYYVYILRNDGSGKLSLINTYTLQDAGVSIVSGDFDSDGNLDLLVIGTDPSTGNWGYSVLLGNGNGSFQLPVFYPQNVNGGGTAVVADFNRDGKLDLAVQAGQSVAILLGNGNGTFAAPVQYYDGGGAFLVTADFNGDGKLDLAEGGAPTALLFGNGDGTFQAAVFPANLNNFVVAFTADLNNDGKPDLLSYDQVALGNGDGTFTLLPALSNQIAALADLNGDGKLDLLVSIQLGHYVQEGGVQLGNGDGTFGAVIPIAVQGGSFGALISDMNGDGRPDLIITPIIGAAVVLNTTAAGFEVSATEISPASLTAGASATSTLSVIPTFGFSGTVNLSCAITPAVTPAPTCSLSKSTVQISGSTAQSVTVTVGTTAPSTTGMLSPIVLPPGSQPFGWTLVCTVMLIGFSGLASRNRRRGHVLVVMLAMLTWVACGGSSSSSSHSTQRTPAGTYTATVTATSGSLSDATAFKVTVQ